AAGQALDQFLSAVVCADVLAGGLHGGLDDVLLNLLDIADGGDDLGGVGGRAAPDDGEVGFDLVAVVAVKLQRAVEVIDAAVACGDRVVADGDDVYFFEARVFV